MLYYYTCGTETVPQQGGRREMTHSYIVSRKAYFVVQVKVFLAMVPGFDQNRSTPELGLDLAQGSADVAKC